MKNIKKILFVLLVIAFTLQACKNTKVENNERQVVSNETVVTEVNDMSRVFSNDRNDYDSDEKFANFRNVKLGSLKDNILYRGASPIDNEYNRAKYVDNLIKNAGVKYDIDLSDSEDKVKQNIAKADFDSQYFKILYDNGKVSLVDMSVDMDYKSEDFGKKVVKAMVDMSKNEGPYYIHCVDGIDRTGFLCILIDALAGASYEEIVNDYMLSYENYYGLKEANNKEEYDKIKKANIDDVLRYLAVSEAPINGDVPLEELQWNNIVGRYITDRGMSFEELDNWYNNVLKTD